MVQYISMFDYVHFGSSFSSKVFYLLARERERVSHVSSHAFNRNITED